MKIFFDDKSFIECRKSDNPDKILMIIQAKDHENPLKKITNTVEMSIAEFKLLISDML
jgi:hypothetical protein